MGGRHFQPEPIIHKLREAEIKLAGGKATGEVCRELGISEQIYYRWRKEYGGMQVSQAKKLKDLERENARLKKLVAEQALDKAILEDLFLLLGPPDHIRSDNGAEFTATAVREWLHRLDVQTLFIAPGCPRGTATTKASTASAATNCLTENSPTC